MKQIVTIRNFEDLFVRGIRMAPTALPPQFAIVEIAVALALSSTPSYHATPHAKHILSANQISDTKGGAFCDIP